MKIKTIDVNCKEWFDKANGNSYLAGSLTINYGTKNQKEYKIPFCYGYGEYYLEAAFEVLKENETINILERSLIGYCRNNNIILRNQLIENCKKRELK